MNFEMVGKKDNNYSNDGNFSFKTLPETFECVDHTHANWLMMAMNQFEYFYKKTLKINRFNVYGYKDTLFPYAWISGVCWLNHASEWQTMHFEDKRKWCQNFIFIDCNFTIIRKRRQKKHASKNNRVNGTECMSTFHKICSHISNHIWHSYLNKFDAICSPWKWFCICW